MDNFDKQLLIALAIAFIIGTPLEIILTKRYKKQGRSIKYLSYKIAFAVYFPIITIPFLLTDVVPFWGKVMGMVLGGIAGLLYLISVTSARKSFRKILGLPPIDEDTGELIKKNDEKKDE